MHVNLAHICRLFGISRQANYQYLKNQQSHLFTNALIVEQVRFIRAEHPRIGTRKLYVLLQSFFEKHQLKIGRDALFYLLYENGLLIRRRKRSVQTTMSKHWMKKWPNLIKNLSITQPNQLWVSDITYWKIGQQFKYISFITDAFSRKIVGYYLSSSLSAAGCIQALQMALSGLIEEPTMHLELVHHSDRGAQYCSDNYVRLLQKHHIKISMTETGDPLENAIAERVNGIIKQEYLNQYKPKSNKEAQLILAKSVQKYNQERPHSSISYHTPDTAHSNVSIPAKRTWKNYYTQKNVKPC